MSEIVPLDQTIFQNNCIICCSWCKLYCLGCTEEMVKFSRRRKRFQNWDSDFSRQEWLKFHLISDHLRWLRPRINLGHTIRLSTSKCIHFTLTFTFTLHIFVFEKYWQKKTPFTICQLKIPVQSKKWKLPFLYLTPVPQIQLPPRKWLPI